MDLVHVKNLPLHIYGAENKVGTRKRIKACIILFSRPLYDKAWFSQFFGVRGLICFSWKASSNTFNWLTAVKVTIGQQWFNVGSTVVRYDTVIFADILARRIVLTERQLRSNTHEATKKRRKLRIINSKRRLKK